MKSPDRSQIDPNPKRIHDLIPPSHKARLVWELVRELDLTPLYDEIKAVEGHAGRPPIDPRILVALWLYGTDEGIASARELNRALHAVLPERAIYRIDHYLGKETVQNLLVFRFANGMFEPLWNARYVDHVQITVAESLGTGGRAGYYDWSHITFPRGASTSNCTLCHDGDSYELPLAAGLLGTTVRTTGEWNGDDETEEDVAIAFEKLPNNTDWINSPTASSCFYCHTSIDAWGHMTQNGGLLTVPDVGPWTNRSGLVGSLESCTICHGPGRVADLDVVHNKR